MSQTRKQGPPPCALERAVDAAAKYHAAQLRDAMSEQAARLQAAIDDDLSAAGVVHQMGEALAIIGLAGTCRDAVVSASQELQNLRRTGVSEE